MHACQAFTACDLGSPLLKAVNRHIALRNLHEFGIGIIREAANVSGPACQSKLNVAFNEGLLGTLALSHIDVDAHHPLRTPIFIVRNGTASLDPSDLAGWEDNAILSVVLLPPVGKGLFAKPFRPRKILRVYPRSPGANGRLGSPLG